jgi:hypothetical protein
MKNQFKLLDSISLKMKLIMLIILSMVVLPPEFSAQLAGSISGKITDKINNEDFSGADELALEKTINFTPLPVSPIFKGEIAPMNDDSFDITANHLGALSDNPAKNWTSSWINYSATTTGVENNNLSTVPNFRLEQNYPNPFNSSTQINFSVTKASQVKLAVYNILDQEVAVLLDEFVNVGSYSKSFNAKDLSSGLYIYTIEAGPVSISKKMTLLK